MTQFDWTLAWGAAAVIVIGGVWLFNAWQERNWRRRAQEAFREKHKADVLLGEPVLHDLPDPARVEPRFDAYGAETVLATTASDADDDFEPDAAEIAEGGRDGALDAEVDYIVTLQPEKPLAAEELRRALEQSARLPRQPAWEALADGRWEALNPARAGEYEALRAGLQLADRRGAVDQTAFTRFCDAMQYLAERWPARIQYPDRRQALEQARKLDAFCAQVDVVIGLNLVSRNGAPLLMKKVMQLTDAAGLRPNAPHGWQFVDEEGRPLFGLVHVEGQTIDPARARDMTVFGLTFTLDVPKVPGGVAVFERVSKLAKHFAHELDADLVDDHRNTLTEAALESIRQQLTVIYSNMELRGLTPGGALALRVFN